VREGLRAPRRRRLVVGAVLLLLSMGATGTVLVAGMRGFNWNTIKPAGLLIRELGSPSPQTSDAALAELQARFSSGKLSAERAKALVVLAIERQKTPTARWTVAWGNLLNAARSAGLLTSEQIESYARHAPSLQAMIRPKVAAGEPTNLYVQISANRLGDPSTFRVSLRQLEARVGDQLLMRGGGGGMSSMGLTVNGWSRTGHQVTLPGPPGEHQISTRWAVEVSDGEKPLAAWEEAFTLDVTVLPEGTPTVEVVEDDSLREPIERSLKIQRCVVYDFRTHLHGSGTVHLNGSPVPLAFEVFWADPEGTREWRMGQVSFTGVGGSGFGFGADLPNDFDLKSVDVVLRPSVKAAAATTDIFRIWGGEIRVRGVEVNLPTATAPPGR
jgi:hypothetical protein